MLQLVPITNEISGTERVSIPLGSDLHALDLTIGRGHSWICKAPYLYIPFRVVRNDKCKVSGKEDNATLDDLFKLASWSS